MTVEKADLVAQKLLEIKAVNFSPEAPYTWASGLKAPIYTDNRLIMSYPSVRSTVEDALAELIKENFPDVDVIAGTATAGIPHAAFVSERLDLPMIYVRSSAKDHGKQNAIEGALEVGAKVVIIEDLISTGGSVITAADKIQEAGGEVIAAVAIFDYLLAASKEAFEKEGYPLMTLTNYVKILDYAVKDPKLSPYYDKLMDWYKDPKAWSEIHG